MAREVRLVRTRRTRVLALVLSSFFTGDCLLPRVFAFRDPLPQRLALAAQSAAFVLPCLLVATGLLSAASVSVWRLDEAALA